MRTNEAVPDRWYDYDRVRRFPFPHSGALAGSVACGYAIPRYEFDEHGIPMPGSGASSGTFSPKTYQGALSVNDDRNDSGLYLMGHRHYAPELGRFISRDPIGFAGGLNLFNGAGTSPVNRVDPSGLDPRDYKAVYTGGGTGYGMDPASYSIVRARKYTNAEYQAYIAQTIRFINGWNESLGPCGEANRGLGQYIDALNNSHYGYQNVVPGESFLGGIFNATMQTTKMGYPEDRRILINRNMLDELMSSGADPAEVGAQLLHEGGHLVQGCSRWVPFLNERGANKIYRADSGSSHPIRKSMDAYFRSLPVREQRSYTSFGPFGR